MSVDAPANAPADVDLFVDGSLPPMLVRASAGTGKTYRLTGRLLQIMFQGAAPESVLATTFTRKAAGEILERMLLSLAKASDEENPEALEALREQLGLESLPRSACSQLLKKLMANVHRLRICTLDSLFTQLAKSFPFELRLPPAWRLTDEIEELWLRERAVSTVVSVLDPRELGSLLSMLSKGETKRSVIRELVQVVDGTYTLSRQSESDAWHKLDAPTQPENAEITRVAGELRQVEVKQPSVRKKLDALASLLESRQLDAITEDVVTRNYAKAKLADQPVKFGRSVLPEELDDALGVMYAAARSQMLALLAAQNDATGQVLSLYEGQMTQLKHAIRMLGFDDLSVRLAKQFSSVDQDTLRRRMDGAIDHLLLDEFQDTSPPQWQVLRPLARRTVDLTIDPDPGADDPDAAVPRSFFCVGDTKQAIYGWRGGVAEIFDTVCEQVPGVQSCQLNTSYRSSPVIMDFVNDVFKNLNRHPIAEHAATGTEADKETYEARALLHFSEQFPEHVAKRKELSGYVRMETSKKVDSRDAAAKTLACYELASDRIRQISEAAPDKSIGVLTRTNRGVASLIYLLEQRGVDVSQEGGNPLIDSAAVELVLSALMMAEHPADGRWRYHVQTSPLGEIDGLSAVSIRARLTEIGIARTVHWLASRLAKSCDERDSTRLKQLTRLAISYESNATARVRDFVRMVREKRVERPQAAQVRVMTVHQSKGLEFDAVFLPELDGALSGRAPSCVADTPKLDQPPVAVSRYCGSKSWHFLDSHWRKVFGKDAASKMTEAMCLLYVAMTRARQALYLCVPPGKAADKKPAALIASALESDTELSLPEMTLCERGDEHWFASDAKELSKQNSVGESKAG